MDKVAPGFNRTWCWRSARAWVAIHFTLESRVGVSDAGFRGGISKRDFEGEFPRGVLELRVISFYTASFSSIFHRASGTNYCPPKAPRHQQSLVSIHLSRQVKFGAIRTPFPVSFCHIAVT